MSDWLQNKGAGTWTFIPQPNKWGYLNDPRWMSQQSAPVNYDGRESSEPQIWNDSNEPFSKTGANVHNPCGHWHKPTGIPYFPPIENNSVVWLSCPQGVITTNKYVFFITTDQQSPDSIYITRFNISTQTNQLFYQEILPSNESTSEPQISVASNGVYHIAHIARVITTPGIGNDNGVYFILFTDDAILKTGYVSLVEAYSALYFFGNNTIIDPNGTINTIYAKYDPVIFKTVYTFAKSTDLGVSWSRNNFLQFSGTSVYPQFTKDSSDILWFSDLNKNILYQSVDGGTTWTLTNATIPASGFLSCFDNKILLLRKSGSNMYSSVSIDAGINFTDYLITTLIGGYALYGFITCNGKINAIIFNYGTGIRTWFVYESTEGQTWTLKAQFDQSGTTSVPNPPFIGMVSSGNIAFTGYYMAMNYGTEESMSFWLSVDGGINWISYPTAFNKQV